MLRPVIHCLDRSYRGDGHIRMSLPCRCPSLCIPRLQWAFIVMLCGLVCWPMVAASDTTDPHLILQRMASAYSGIQDYTALFIKRERIKGKLSSPEKIELRFQEPFKVYMAWRAPHKGRVVVFVKGENNDKMLINPGGLFKSMRLTLDPLSSLATRNSHHSILQAGIQNTIQYIMDEYQRAHERDQLEVHLHGEKHVNGRPAYHLELIYPDTKTAGYYAYRGEIWIDKEHYLPTKLLIYDWDNRLYEHYEYHDLHLNPGLEDEAFRLDPSEPMVASDFKGLAATVR